MTTNQRDALINGYLKNRHIFKIDLTKFNASLIFLQTAVLNQYFTINLVFCTLTIMD